MSHLIYIDRSKLCTLVLAVLLVPNASELIYIYFISYSFTVLEKTTSNPMLSLTLKS